MNDICGEVRYPLRNKETPRAMRLRLHSQRKEAENGRIKAVSDKADHEELEEVNDTWDELPVENDTEMTDEEWKYFRKFTRFPYSREAEAFFDHLHDKYRN